MNLCVGNSENAIFTHNFVWNEMSGPVRWSRRKPKKEKQKQKKRKEKKLKKLTCSRLELWNFQYSPPLEWQPNQLRHIAFIASIEFFPCPFYGTIRDVSMKGAMSRGILKPTYFSGIYGIYGIHIYVFFLSYLYLASSSKWWQNTGKQSWSSFDWVFWAVWSQF